MTVLSLLHVGLPAPLPHLPGVIGNANAFMAMLMIGVGFKLNGDSSQPGKIVKILAARYSLAIVLALVFLFPAALWDRIQAGSDHTCPQPHVLCRTCIYRKHGGGCGTGKRGKLYIRRHQHGADYRDTDDNTVGTERNKTDGRGAGWRKTGRGNN